MKILSRRAQSRRGFLRNVATVVAVAAPIVIVPILLQSGAEAGARATFSGPACDQGQLDISDLTVGSDASVTVALNETDCDHQVVSLVAYKTQGPDYNSAGTQTLFDIDTEVVTATAATLHVAVPNCFLQVDVIYGDDAPQTLQDQELYFTNHGTLIASFNAGTESCESGPSVSPTDVSSSPSSPSPSTSPTSCSSTPGGGESSSGSPSGSPSSGSSTPPCTSVSPTSVSSSPGGGSSSPGGDGSSSPGTPSSSVSPTGSTTVTATATETETASHPSSELPTSVEGVTFTQAPNASALPLTGMSVLGMVLLGLELLAGGTLAVLFVRRRSSGVHR